MEEDEEEKHILLFDTDPFTFQTCFLAFLTLFLILILNISHKIKLVVFFLVIIVFFYFLEISVTKVIDKICNSSDFFKKSTLFLFPYSLLAFLYFIILIIISKRVIPFSKHHTFLSSFFSLLYFSLIIFSLSTAIKGFLLSFKVISDNFIRSGFFSIFQLSICFFRALFTFHTWINWIHERSQHYIFSSFLYFLIKGYSIALIAYEMYRSITGFIQNKKFQLPDFNGISEDDECLICCCPMVEPKVLECGHVFCYRCINKWVKRRPICPLCRSKTHKPFNIDMMNGYIPFFILLCVF